MDFKKALAVLSLSTLTILVSTAVSPALAGIKLAFPGYSDDIIRLVLTIPPLFIIPVSFLSYSLITRYGYKRILIFGICVYLLGGLGSIFMPTFWLLLAARALTGIGCGFIVPMAQILIGVNFSGATRAKLTGWSASTSYLMGMFASIIVSRLAGVNWRCTFLIYAFGIAVLILNILYLPTDSENAPVTMKAERGNWKMYLVAVGMGFVNIAFYTFTTSISLFMQGESIGTLASSGTVVAAFMLFGFFVGLIAQRIRIVLKSYTVLLGCFMMSAGYAVLSKATTVWVVALGAMLVGGSYSILYSCIFIRINKLAKSLSETTFFICVTTAAMFMGQFLSQPLLKMIENIFGMYTYRFDYLFLSEAIIAVSLIVFVIIRKGILDDRE